MKLPTKVSLSLCLLVFSGLAAAPASADRVVLSPLGATLTEESYKTEFAVSPNNDRNNRSWLAYSSPDGIELEMQRIEATSDTKQRYALDIEYPLPTLKGFPALSLGVRDLAGTGTEHGAFYLVGSKSVLLSRRQKHAVRDVMLNLGAGTGRIGGLFLGIEARLTLGVNVYAEIYRHRPNVGLALPLVRNMQVRAYSLDGDIFYGLSYHWTH